MTGGPPAPSRHPSSRPSSLPPSISLECPDGDSAVTPHLSIPVPQMPWTQAAAKKPASSSFSFSADPGGSGRWPSGPRVAQELPFLSAERLGVVRPRLSALPRRPRALVWPALPLRCDVCIRSHFEPQPGLVEGDTCGRAPPLGFWDPQGRVWGPPRVESQPRGSGCHQSPGTSRPGLCGQQGHGGRQDWPQPSSRARARRAAPRGLTEPPP